MSDKKKFSTKKSPQTNDFTKEFHQILKKKKKSVHSNPLKILPNTQQERAFPFSGNV